MILLIKPYPPHPTHPQLSYYHYPSPIILLIQMSTEEAPTRMLDFVQYLYQSFKVLNRLSEK